MLSYEPRAAGRVTARALVIDVSPGILAIADEVIE
jgi:hypothetical protein